MFKVNEFNSSKQSKVIKTTSLMRILARIKSSGTTTSQIIDVRNLGKSNPEYQNKKTELPTVRFNFLFNERASNENIIEPTGLIYIDVDNCEEIDLTNILIHAAWKSVSNCGYGILVKVDGLTLDNFSSTYIAIAEKLGINADKGAKKATQQTILSYDPNLYFNKKSITFLAINEKVSSSSIQKEERLIGVDDTFLGNMRFSNINDYFQGENENLDYIIFEGDKETIVQPYLPYRIEEGKRNITLYFHLTQYAMLNPTMGSGMLKKIAEKIVSHFEGEEYTEAKIQSIVNAVINKREAGELELYANKERRILFNPKKEITKKQKLEITGKIMGRFKRQKTQETIYQTIENWNFQLDGKITQQLVAEKTGMGIATIKRYWNEFKDYVKNENKANTDTLNENVVVDTTIEEKVEINECNEVSNESEEKVEVIQYLLNKYKMEFEDAYVLYEVIVEKYNKTLFDSKEIDYIMKKEFNLV